MSAVEYTFIFFTLLSSGFWLYFLTGFLRYRPVKDPVSTARVSVVIAAHNEYENLKRLLPALLEQDHPDYEILVCNDRSTDETPRLAREYFDEDRIRFIHIRRTPDDFNAKKYALTRGIQEALGTVVLLTDADCYPRSERWISGMTEEADREYQFILGYSGYRKEPGFLNHFIRFDTLVTALQYLGIGLNGTPYMGVGRNMAYTREVFMKNDGFKGFMAVTGGDDDLFVNRYANRSNTKFALDQDFQTISVPERSWKTFFRQKLRHLSVGRHYSAGIRLILGLFSSSNLFFWVTFVWVLFAGNLYVALIGYLLRIAILYLTFSAAAGKLAERYSYGLLPVLDVLYPIYHSFTGLSALAAKRTKWN